MMIPVLDFLPVAIAGKTFLPEIVLSPAPLSDYWRVRCGFEYASDGKARGWSKDFPELPDKGFPDTCTTKFSGFMKMNNAWKSFLYELIYTEGVRAGMNRTEIDFAFGKIYDSGRFISNGSGVQTDKFMIAGITCGLNIVRGLREKGNYLVCEAIDYRKGVPVGISPDTHPHLFHEARTETMENGVNVSNRFHWLRGRPVIFPFMVKSDPNNLESQPGEQWIEKRKLERLTVAELPAVLQ